MGAASWAKCTVRVPDFFRAPLLLCGVRKQQHDGADVGCAGADGVLILAATAARER